MSSLKTRFLAKAARSSSVSGGDTAGTGRVCVPLSSVPMPPLKPPLHEGNKGLGGHC